MSCGKMYGFQYQYSKNRNFFLKKTGPIELFCLKEKIMLSFLSNGSGSEGILNDMSWSRSRLRLLLPHSCRICLATNIFIV